MKLLLRKLNQKLNAFIAQNSKQADYSACFVFIPNKYLKLKFVKKRLNNRRIEQMNISLLTIGDEICIGQVINTNASWIADECTKLGAKVHYHSTVGDNEPDITAELDRLLYVTDMVIITGGLGPTHDDITKEVLADYFNDNLVLSEPTLKHIEDLLSNRGIKITENSKSVALLPTKCKILRNQLGTAPGMLFDIGEKYVISLPGVPFEMKYIMSDSVLPFIYEKIKVEDDQIVLYKVLQTAGVSESVLAELIGDPATFLNGCTLAFLPSYHGVRLRIGSESNSEEECQQNIKVVSDYIYTKADKFIIGEADDSLASVCGKLLKSQSKTVSFAESCTGGLLSGEMTSIPGSSEYFQGSLITYSNDIKEHFLDIRSDTLISHGAVSEETAIEMAHNVREKFNTTIGISITGIAGPDGGTTEKPVGTVWIGYSDQLESIAIKFKFGGDRIINRNRAVSAALNLLFKKLKNQQ